MNLQSDDPLDNIAPHDRVSVPAVLVDDGDDPAAALTEARIFDAIRVPVTVDTAPGTGADALGDGVTPNLTGVLTADGDDDDEAWTRQAPAEAAPPEPRPRQPKTATLPPAYGMQPMAPVRRR